MLLPALADVQGGRAQHLPLSGVGGSLTRQRSCSNRNRGDAGGWRGSIVFSLPYEASAIAVELGITTVEAQLAHDLLMGYLRRDKGRAALEKAALGAAQETDRNDRG